MGYAEHGEGVVPAGIVETSRGLWAFSADVDLLRRLATSGIDWLSVDAQHGPVDRVTSGNPLGRVVRAATSSGARVGAFAGTPRNAAALREHGIHCLAVTTDLAVVAAGVEAVLHADEAPERHDPASREGGPEALARHTVEE